MLHNNPEEHRSYVLKCHTDCEDRGTEEPRLWRL